MNNLVDGDIICYSVGFATEGTRYMCGDNAEFRYKADAVSHCAAMGLDPSNIQKMSIPDPVENALHSVKIMLESIKTATNATNNIVYLTGKGNFRDNIATIQPYKGNRLDEKPTHYQAIRDYLVNVHKAIVVDGMEADDAMGIAQCADKNNETCICTLDKDLDMIEGWHYNWKKQEKYWVDKDRAMLAFYTQLLTGDKTDNIMGLPGIGPAKAARILKDKTMPEQIYEAVEDAYLSYFNDLEESEVKDILNETGQLLWIGRESNINNEIEFNPPGWKH